ncbi:hypothetical protein [Tatumella citrea]|uniref:Uncharacterized protein n=1 Tax=Tatumella citrea TaxID=53336 RepID=A0A1Y0LCL3_TATCI|nr:hypothetical protein [Tatumella citrea]ARU95637.1 hypothetical protein A7K98_19060 [Tatumella citrea]ARU99679.1 hypothetical protein A7K99_19045 [Tatumella citrea]
MNKNLFFQAHSQTLRIVYASIVACRSGQGRANNSDDSYSATMNIPEIRFSRCRRYMVCSSLSDHRNLFITTFLSLLIAFAVRYFRLPIACDGGINLL